MTENRGDPIAYTVLAEGTPVQSSDGETIGTVRRVLADVGTDVFDGIVIETPGGERFVDAPEIGDLYERLVLLTIDAAQARDLPPHSAGPAVVDVSADDLTGNSGGKVTGAVRRAWDRLTGNY